LSELQAQVDIWSLGPDHSWSWVKTRWRLYSANAVSSAPAPSVFQITP